MKKPRFQTGAFLAVWTLTILMCVSCVQGAERPQWRISTGVAIRAIDAKFTTTAPCQADGIPELQIQPLQQDGLTLEESQASDRGHIGVSPYVKFDWIFHQFDEGDLSLFFMYAWMSTHPSTGSVKVTHTIDDGEGGLFTEQCFDWSSILDIRLHEFTLALQLTRNLAHRVHWVVAVGPTFNLFDYSLSTNITTPTFMQVGAYSYSAQKFRMGVLCQLGITVDLDAHNRWFLELFGRYNYVGKFTGAFVGDESSQVEVNASSFSGGIGIGVNL